MHRHHPLWHRRFSQANRHQDRSSLATAVERRSRLMDHAWLCIIDGPERLLSAPSGSRPYRVYPLAAAQMLLGGVWEWDYLLPLP
jgi:hypothetical protein